VGLDNDTINPHFLFLASPTALMSERDDMISGGASHQGHCQKIMLRKRYRSQMWGTMIPLG